MLSHVQIKAHTRRYILNLLNGLALDTIILVEIIELSLVTRSYYHLKVRSIDTSISSFDD